MAKPTLEIINNVPYAVMPDGRKIKYADIMAYNNPGMQYDDVTLDVIVATPPSAEAAMMPGGEPAPDTFGDTTARMASPYFETAAELAATAGRRPTYFENPLMQGIERTGQYIGDMTLAGLNAGLGTVYGGAGLLGETFGGDTQDERRLARDLAAMFDAAGPAPEGRMLGLLTDAGAPRAMAADVAERLSQRGPMPTTYSNPIPGLRAFHGSPHDFDRFDMSKIGTGEGAQAYGHGLYFAENEGVARGYRDALTDGPTHVSIYGERFSPDELHGIEADAASAVLKYDEPSGWRDYLSRFYDDEQVSEAMGLLESGVIKAAPPGHMYEVQINANPEDFLDWDKPLSEQPKKVQEVFRPRIEEFRRLGAQIGNDPDGATLEQIAHPTVQLDDVDWSRGLRQQAADYMREAGIPGIKYLDSGSRGAGEGSRNYVIFDENLINIVRKYGIAGAAAALGVSQAEVAQAMAQGQQQPQGLLSMGAQ